MSLATELDASLKEFLAGGLVDLHENGGRTAFDGALSREVRGDGEKPLLHLWAERFNVTRSVLAITDHSEQRQVLVVERFGRAKPERPEFVRREFERAARQLSREEFCGIELHQIPPLVYLVVPALRFHPSTDELMKFLSSELEIVRVGLGESWRRGLRVVMRQWIVAP